MGFRTVVIKSRVKLELRLNMMVIRGDVEKKIFINEINTLIIQSTAVAVTAALLNELVKNNIKVVFCDEKFNPSSELLPYYGAHNTSKRYKQQIKWYAPIKNSVWKIIVRQKILGQADVLSMLHCDVQAEMLRNYADEIEDGDVTNREGHAAKVYFNTFLEEGRRSESFINGCLNYGYAVLLSAFNREIVAAGYFTQLGIWHDNEFNNFNLASDLMEPFRPYVDRVALGIEDGDREFKTKLTDILNYNVKIDGKNTTFDLAIRQYARSVFDALNSGETDIIVFPQEIEWR
ncbi:MAG: type II CRISPR-associated endonuclease Cas1 [Clostridiales bacterium]|nr:type II CRISPR-associated endonuclease Cas1 [Clostridiales bacterium]